MSIGYRAEPVTVIVDPNGNGNARTIQDGIDLLPAAGGRVLIKAGHYVLTAPLVIPSVGSITLEAESIGVDAWVWEYRDPLLVSTFPVIVDTGSLAIDCISYTTATGYEQLVLRGIAFRSDGTAGSRFLHAPAASAFVYTVIDSCYVFGFDTIFKFEHTSSTRCIVSTFQNVPGGTPVFSDGTGASSCLYTIFDCVGGFDTAWNAVSWVAAAQTYVYLYGSNSYLVCGATAIGGLRLFNGSAVDLAGTGLAVDVLQMDHSSLAAWTAAYAVTANAWGLGNGYRIKKIALTVNACVDFSVPLEAGSTVTMTPNIGAKLNEVKSLKYTSATGDLYATVLDWSSSGGGIGGAIKIHNSHGSNTVAWQITVTMMDGSTDVSTGTVTPGLDKLVKLWDAVGSGTAPYSGVKIEVKNNAAGNNASVRVDAAVVGVDVLI
jgi:hypothetical protein